MKKFSFLIISLLMSMGAFSQGAMDALRYSHLNLSGTARFNALGGAFGALGGDFTTSGTNPAGIGVLRSSEITFTPSLYHSMTDAGFMGQSRGADKFNLNFGNAGLVASFNRDDESSYGWQNFNLGIGYNRTNNFNNRTLIEGRNETSSLIDVYLNQANGTHYDNLEANYPFSAHLAWQTFLIDTAPGTTSSYVGALNGYGQTQSMNINSSGSMGETVITMAANYSSKFYVGATFAFPNIEYRETKTYTETDDQNLDPDFSSFELTENLHTSGSGFAFKLGAIYKPVQWLRLGGAIHTPTFFRLTDSWNNDLTTQVYGQGFAYDSPEGAFDYRLRTPMRAIGSLAFVVGKYGLISADYTHVDYSSAKLRSGAYSFNDENTSIDNGFFTTGNVRLGTEWRYKFMSFRAGYAMLGDPQTDSFTIGQSNYSGGIGYRNEKFFVDVAYVLHDRGEDNYYLYNPNLVEPATIESTSSSYLATVGIKF